LLALGVGTLLGSGLPQLFSGLPVEGTAVITPLSVPILFSLVVKLALFVFVAVAVHEERPADSAGSWRDGLRSTPGVVGDALRLTRHNRTILLLLGTTVVGGLTLTGLETFWQPQMANLLGDPSANTLLFGLAMAGSFLAGMVGNVLATPLSRLFKQRYALVAALVRGLQGLLMVGLAWQTAVPGFVIFFWLMYLNLGVLNSPHNTLLNAAIPAARRSAMLSVESLASYVGSMVGSIVLGLLAQQASIGAAWIVAGVALMVSLLLYLRIDAQQQPPERTYEPEPTIFEICEEANIS
jgi:predicted MFS family arabinose efflux permease